jgi:hypothetical protein
MEDGAGGEQRHRRERSSLGPSREQESERDGPDHGRLVWHRRGLGRSAGTSGARSDPRHPCAREVRGPGNTPHRRHRAFGRGPRCRHQDFDRVAASPRLSMTTFGTMRPKLIARMIVVAVMPSAIVAPKSSRVVFELLVSNRRPLVILKRKTPGIIDTTAAKPTAAMPSHSYSPAPAPSRASVNARRIRQTSSDWVRSPGVTEHVFEVRTSRKLPLSTWRLSTRSRRIGPSNPDQRSKS